MNTLPTKHLHLKSGKLCVVSMDEDGIGAWGFRGFVWFGMDTEERRSEAVSCVKLYTEESGSNWLVCVAGSVDVEMDLCSIMGRLRDENLFAMAMVVAGEG